jgi:hypothetical protein
MRIRNYTLSCFLDEHHLITFIIFDILNKHYNLEIYRQFTVYLYQNDTEITRKVYNVYDLYTKTNQN